MVNACVGDKAVLANQWVEIYTDGACSGNPGPGGWGAILRWNGVEKELWGGEAATTNNRMEITAVIRALESLKYPVAIKAYTDSQYVKNGITVWMHNWKKNGWINSQKNPVANAELWRRLDELCAQHQMQWYWVRGHDGHPENTRADELARRGVDEVRKSSNQ